MPRRANRIVKGAKVVPSPHNAAWYGRRLKVLAAAMHKGLNVYIKDGDEVLEPAVREKVADLRERFVLAAQEGAEGLATAFVNKQITATKAGFRAAVKPVIEAEEKELEEAKRKKMEGLVRFKVKIDGRKDRATLKRFRGIVEENVGLIKSIPELYFNKVDDAIQARLRGKMTRAALVKRLQEIGGITKRRAEMIADDQVAKSSVAMTAARCKDAGIKKVMWIHGGISKKPRDYHKRKWDGRSGKRNGKPNGLNGFIFEIDKPPVIDLRTMERGLPGQAVNCKCNLVPVIEL